VSSDHFDGSRGNAARDIEGLEGPQCGKSRHENTERSCRHAIAGEGEVR
jgi:hypothetical protein